MFHRISKNEEAPLVFVALFSAATSAFLWGALWAVALIGVLSVAVFFAMSLTT